MKWTLIFLVFFVPTVALLITAGLPGFWTCSFNWIRGFQFQEIKRCRRCSHRDPIHYPGCPKRGAM